MADQQIVEFIRAMMTISYQETLPQNQNNDMLDDIVVTYATQISSDEDFASKDSSALFIQAH